VHRSRQQDVERSKATAKFIGTWEVRLEHDGDRFTFKLLHFEHNRDVGQIGRGSTVLVTHTRSIEDGFHEMKLELAKFIPEDLF
jgi:hypothetical protein